MPNPKRRHSKARTRKRRTHQKISAKAISKCAQCGADKIPHRVCSVCGYYRGRPVVSVESSKA